MALGVVTQFLRGGRAVPRTGIKILTSKRGPRNYYKGKGCKSTGRHTSKGTIIPEIKRLIQNKAHCIVIWTHLIQPRTPLGLCTGSYVLMDEKLPKYIVPDLTNCKVRSCGLALSVIFLYRPASVSIKKVHSLCSLGFGIYATCTSIL